MLLDPNSVPKFVTQLKKPSVFSPCEIKNPDTKEVIYFSYIITIKKTFQQMLPPPFLKTPVFGYGGYVYNQDSSCKIIYEETSSPGPTIIATKGIPNMVNWINALEGEHPFAIDPTLDWADPNNLGMVNPEEVPPFPPGLPCAQSPIPIVTHLHGGQTSTVYDGNPNAW